MPFDEFISLEQAASQLEINKVTLMRAIEQGDLKAVRLGRKWKTTHSWLEAWIDKKTVNAEVAEQGA